MLTTAKGEETWQAGAGEDRRGTQPREFEAGKSLSLSSLCYLSLTRPQHIQPELSLDVRTSLRLSSLPSAASGSAAARGAGEWLQALLAASFRASSLCVCLFQL
jgi:hypothetical protein